MARSPQTGIRCNDRYDFSNANAAYHSGCPLYVSEYLARGTWYTSMFLLMASS